MKLASLVARYLGEPLPAAEFGREDQKGNAAPRAGLMLVSCPMHEETAPETPDTLPADWQVEFEERAAIMEYDGGLSRPEAERLALAALRRRKNGKGE